MDPVSRTHNNPPITLEDIPPDLADFIVENCDANIEMANKLIIDNGKADSLTDKLVAKKKQFQELRRRVLAVYTPKDY